MSFAAQLLVGNLVVAGGSGVKRADVAKRRREGLKRVDTELSKCNPKAALSIVKQLQGKPGGLRGFGAAKQVPSRVTAFHELEFGNSELSEELRPLFDSVMDSIEECVGLSLPGSEIMHEDDDDDDDDDGDGDGDEGGGRECSCEEDHFLCLQHESGHFLVGYLLGALPREYRIPSVEDLRNGSRYGFIGGGVKFLQYSLLREVPAPKMLQRGVVTVEICERAMDQISCIALGGLVAEHLTFGHAQGHHSDIVEMTTTFTELGFSDDDANSQMRWAALNTLCILHRHVEARSRLVEAMVQGRSIGFCIDAIEDAMDGKEI